MDEINVQLIDEIAEEKLIYNDQYLMDIRIPDKVCTLITLLVGPSIS